MSAESELVVDCSEQMLQQILKENPAIKRAHEALVETGKAHLLLLRGTGIVVLLLPLHAVLRLRGLLLLTLTLLLLLLLPMLMLLSEVLLLGSLLLVMMLLLVHTVLLRLLLVRPDAFGSLLGSGVPVSVFPVRHWAA